MRVLTSNNAILLWHDTLKCAEDRCSISLNDELEAYLVSLLMRYTNRPDVFKKVLAVAFLSAMQKSAAERQVSLQSIGDECLIFAGLFPRIAEKRNVKIGYFVDLGQSAYATLSRQTNDLFGILAFKFVTLMDVLQSIRPHADLLPLEAYEQWNEVGSQYALKILRDCTRGMPIKR